MGVSTDAIVAFGFDLGEELPELLVGDEPEEFDFDNWVYEKMGVGYETEATHKDRKKELDGFPFDLITHCSYDYPMYFLAVRGSECRARRGYPQELNLDGLSPDKNKAMRDFCEEFGIEWKEPGWHVFSLWG